ncbi:MAG: membrane protein of unknown function [Promethearchaeota archaeon]|nr:MAG: membrane protein of unknown function [Candidatus Lokiarchaeota archaeon]
MSITKFKISESNSTNVNIIRFLSIQIIAISHGLENIGAIGLSNIYGVSAFDLLILISGMLIAYSVFNNMQNERFEFKRYLVSRFSRIYIPVILTYTIMVIVDWINGYNLLHHFTTFVINIALLNDSALNYPYYGFNRHLWAMPFFWWQYLFFGWLLLGTRTTNKKYVYYLVLAFLAFIMGLILFGERMTMKSYYMIIWYMGAIFTFLLVKLKKYIEQKSTLKGEINPQIERKLIKRIKIISIIMALLFFTFAILRSTTFKQYHDTYDLIYNVSLALSVVFFFTFMQYSRFKYPKSIKKAINFLSSYSLTMFLFHMYFYNLVLRGSVDVVFFIFVHIIANLISIGIASFSEMKYTKIRRYLLKKFNLLDNPPKNDVKPIKSEP